MLRATHALGATLLGFILGRGNHLEPPPAELPQPIFAKQGLPLSPSSWRVRVRPPDLGMGFHPKSIVVEVSSLIHPVPGAPDSCEIRLNFAVPRKALASGAVFDQRVAPTLETRAQIDADSPFCPNLEGLDFARTVLRIDRFERDRISGHVQGTLAQTTLTATVEHSCTNDFVTLQPSASQLAFSIPLQDVYVD